MRNLKLAVSLSLALVCAQAWPADDSCTTLFAEGVDWFDQGEYQLAAGLFSEVIRLDPEPQAGDPAYVPYIYLAAAQFQLGNMKSAQAALVQSQVFGVSRSAEQGRRLIEQFAAPIMAAEPEDALVDTELPYSPVAESSLNESEVALIRARVLKKCALASDIADNKLPWYFHYEFGRDLMAAGDAGRAVDSFVLGANVRQQPQRGKRMYGMWYIDYLPYYQMALAYSQMGEWQSASDALSTSRSFGEFTPESRGWVDYADLEQVIRQQTPQAKTDS